VLRYIQVKHMDYRVAFSAFWVKQRQLHSAIINLAVSISGWLLRSVCFTKLRDLLGDQPLIVLNLSQLRMVIAHASH
jgi:hypothetical protein